MLPKIFNYILKDQFCTKKKIGAFNKNIISCDYIMKIQVLSQNY